MATTYRPFFSFGAGLPGDQSRRRDLEQLAVVGRHRFDGPAHALYVHEGVVENRSLCWPAGAVAVLFTLVRNLHVANKCAIMTKPINLCEI